VTEEEALKNALQRERKRRRSAELLLEEKSRELYESFEALEKAHKELLQNQKQLIHSEKMASLGIMSAGVAHEINNPVGYALSNLNVLKSSFPLLTKTITGGTELLGAVTQEPTLVEKISEFQSDLVQDDIEFLLEDAPDLLDETTTGLCRIRDIVDGLKSFAQADASARINVSVNEILKGALAVIGSQLPSEIEVVEDYGDLPELSASKPGLRRVFMNVLLNASEAMARVQRTKHELKIVTRVTDGEVCVSVYDSGCGMTTEESEKLFTPFFTTKDVGEGTGLGLSVSLGVMEEHGGRIEVHTEPGEGSRFDLLFALSD